MRLSPAAAPLVGAVVALGLSACAGGDGEVAQSSPAATAAIATTTNPYGIASIDPAAPNEPVLTVTGGAAPLSLTLGQLDALGDVTVTVDEPFVKKRQTFSGVPLAAVLAKAGVPDTATIDTAALNDYHYAAAAKTMIDSQALIATKMSGAPIPYDQGGPIRIVFPDGTALSSVLDAWNWSLASINTIGSGRPGT